MPGAGLDFLFGSPSLPESRPVEHGDGTYTVAMANGIEYHVRLFRPSEPNDRLVLYHAGHAGYGAPDELVVTDLIERGYAILLFEMPFVGVNASPIKFELPNGPVTISRHDHMSFLASRTNGTPIRYFVEPVVVMLNELSAEFDDVSMIGA